MSLEEEATEDVDDEESFDEAEEGRLPEEEKDEEEEDAEAEVASASVLEDERENGDGQVCFVCLQKYNMLTFNVFFQGIGEQPRE